MSGGAQGAVMTKALTPDDVEALLREIQRYLACVEAFRRKERPQPSGEVEGEKQR